MTEYTHRLDAIFSALADPVRRDILGRVNDSELTINQIATEYDMSLAAVSKHVRVLLEAGLIDKRRHGRYQIVRSNLSAVNEIANYIARFSAGGEK